MTSLKMEAVWMRAAFVYFDSMTSLKMEVVWMHAAFVYFAREAANLNELWIFRNQVSS